MKGIFFNRKGLIANIGLISLILLSYSCIDDECSFDKIHSEIDSLTLTLGKIEIENGENFERIYFSTTNSSKWDSACIGISINQLREFSILHKAVKPSISLPIINNAYACSPPEPEPSQNITSITITSDKKLEAGNVSFQPGQDVSSLFLLAQGDYSIGKFMSIEDYILEQNNNPSIFGTYYSLMVFRLKQKIELSDQRLNFRIAFDDQTIFVLSTDDFIIQ